jgi:hypothetical protein
MDIIAFLDSWQADAVLAGEGGRSCGSVDPSLRLPGDDSFYDSRWGGRAPGYGDDYLPCLSGIRA